MKTGEFLKLITTTDLVYFKILEIEPTAYRTIQICIITEGKVRLKYRHRLYSAIYKSEIGRNYFEVEATEIQRVKDQLQIKMLDDYQLLCTTYEFVFGLLGTA